MMLTLGPSSLLQLPAELRNDIYSLALTSVEDVIISATGRFAKPGLLQVCKQIRNEVEALYYTLNTFRTTVTDNTPNNALAFMSGLSRKACRSIPRLVLQYQSTPAVEVAESYRSLAHLKDIDLLDSANLWVRAQTDAEKDAARTRLREKYDTYWDGWEFMLALVADDGVAL